MSSPDGYPTPHTDDQWPAPHVSSLMDQREPCGDLNCNAVVRINSDRSTPARSVRQSAARNPTVCGCQAPYGMVVR